VRQALDAGASGYLTKRCAPDVLVEAVRKVLAGQTFIEQRWRPIWLVSGRRAPPSKDGWQI